jgi:conjugal transfer pilus assembly protein TrbC
MRRRSPLTPSLAFLLPALLAVVLDAALLPWVPPASGQVVEGVDIGAARARAKAQVHDLEAFSSEIGKRGEALRQQAIDTRTGAQANRARVGSVKTSGAKGAFDFDAMIAGADVAAAGSRLERPKLIVFASLSMPVPSLKTLFRDVTKAGGVVVFRGFKNGSVKDFMAGLAPAFDKGVKIDGVGIDPRLFRAFNVEAVPTYVVTAGDIEPCAGFHCTTALPPYDRLVGNVTTDYALTTVAEGRGPGSAAARVYLAKLRRGGGA